MVRLDRMDLASSSAKTSAGSRCGWANGSSALTGIGRYASPGQRHLRGRNVPKGKPRSGKKARRGERTHREIADEMGISHGTVVNIERAALAKLRRALTRGEAK